MHYPKKLCHDCGKMVMLCKDDRLRSHKCRHGNQCYQGRCEECKAAPPLTPTVPARRRPDELRQRVSNYMLEVELLVSTLHDYMPVLREFASNASGEIERKQIAMLLDRIGEVLKKVDDAGDAR